MGWQHGQNDRGSDAPYGDPGMSGRSPAMQISPDHPIVSAMRNYLTILRLLHSLCVGPCLLWTVPAYAVDTLRVTPSTELLRNDVGVPLFSGVNDS